MGAAEQWVPDETRATAETLSRLAIDPSTPIAAFVPTLRKSECEGDAQTCPDGRFTAARVTIPTVLLIRGGRPQMSGASFSNSVCSAGKSRASTKPLQSAEKDEHERFQMLLILRAAPIEIRFGLNKNYLTR
jgi:hypothetical protein